MGRYGVKERFEGVELGVVPPGVVNAHEIAFSQIHPTGLFALPGLVVQKAFAAQRHDVALPDPDHRRFGRFEVVQTFTPSPLSFSPWCHCLPFWNFRQNLREPERGRGMIGGAPQKEVLLAPQYQHAHK
jgi:hypothetical protein